MTSEPAQAVNTGAGQPDTTMTGSETSTAPSRVMTLAQVKAIGVGQTCHACNESRQAGDCIMINGRCSNCVYYGSKPNTPCVPSTTTFAHSLYKHALNSQSKTVRQPKARGQPWPAPEGCDQQPNGPAVLLPPEVVNSPVDHLKKPPQTMRDMRNKRFSQAQQDQRIKANPGRSSYGGRRGMSPPPAADSLASSFAYHSPGLSSSTIFCSGAHPAFSTPNPYHGSAMPLYHPPPVPTMPFSAFNPASQPSLPGSAFDAHRQLFAIQQERLALQSRDLELQKQQFKLEQQIAGSTLSYTPRQHMMQQHMPSPSPTPRGHHAHSAPAPPMKKSQRQFVDVDSAAALFAPQPGPQIHASGSSSVPRDERESQRKRPVSDIDATEERELATVAATINDKAARRPVQEHDMLVSEQEQDIALDSLLQSKIQETAGSAERNIIMNEAAGANATLAVNILSVLPNIDAISSAQQDHRFKTDAKRIVENEGCSISADDYEARWRAAQQKLRRDADATALAASEPPLVEATTTSSQDADKPAPRVREGSLDPDLDYTNISADTSAPFMGGGNDDDYVSD